MWDGLSTRLTGEIVVLEPLRPEHEEGLFEAAREPEIWRWLPWPKIESREGFGRWMEEALAASDEGREAAFATTDAQTGKPIGSTRFIALRPEHRGLEIGWTWLAPSAWQTGANIEAKLLMLEHAFEHMGCIRVEFKTDARNERSRRALEALPAQFEGVFRRHMVIGPGQFRDSAYYSVIDSEWDEVRANLRRRLARRI